MVNFVMKRHNWFPDRSGLDVCGACGQPDIPETGVFCPGPKPATAEPWKDGLRDAMPIGNLNRAIRELDWSADEDQAVIRIDPEQVKGWVGTPGATDSDPIPKCTHCGFTAPTWEASMEHAGPCGDKHRSLASAMSVDLHHTIYDLIRPWRGK